MAFGLADAKARLATCSKCPEFAPGPMRNLAYCRLCRCIINAKVLLPASTCPLDKWPKPEST